ncbi:MAG: glycosyltransferase family 4 protein [Actinomycetia bacterium]|nr:glycosyltransferase family 4 protein [Actinomycetes bacterium]
MPADTLHILIDARMAAWSGIGRYSRGLVYGLLQLPPEEGVRLTLLVASGQKYFSARRHPIHLITADKPPLSLAGLRELSQIAHRVSPDVLHCTHISTPRPRVKYPLVTTLHDLTPLIIEDVMSQKSKRRVYRWLNVRAVKHSQVLIAPSHQTARDIESFFPAAAEKLAVIPEAADDFISGEKQLMPELMHRLPPTQFFLSMGNTKPHKNLPVLLRAFERFYQQAAALPGFDPQACPRLLLVGKNQPGYLESQLPAGPARELLCFTGTVTDEELRWLYAHTLAFVFPSRYEGFGLPPLEAAGFAAPVLAAHASSLPEVLGEGEAAGAAYFDPDDAGALAELLLRIARDQDFVDALAAAAWARTRLFSWRATASATLALYRRLTSD